MYLCNFQHRIYCLHSTLSPHNCIYTTLCCCRHDEMCHLMVTLSKIECAKVKQWAIIAGVSLSLSVSRFVPRGGLPEAWWSRSSGPAPGWVHPRRPKREAEGVGAPPGGCDGHPEGLPVPVRGCTSDQGAVSVLGVSSWCVWDKKKNTLYSYSLGTLKTWLPNDGGKKLRSPQKESNSK